MKIETYTNNTQNYNIYRNNNNKKFYNNNVSFGFNLSGYLNKTSKRQAAYLDSVVSRYGNYLGLDTKTAKETLTGVSGRRIEFFKRIADRYNGQNFYAETKEAIDAPLRIFNAVTNPHQQHFYILHHIKGSFEELEKFMRHADNEKHMKFIQDFHKQYRGYEHRDNFLIDILESENRDKYLENINKYKSYIIVNSKNPDSIKELDKLVSAGKFNQAEYDIQYSMDKITSSGKNTGNVLKKSLLEEHYSPEGLHLLRKMCFDFTFHTPNESQLNEFLRIYNTTNKNNIKLRENFLNAFKNCADDCNKKEMIDTEITALRELFEKAEEDKHARNFLSRVITQGIGTQSIEEINDILKVVPAKKADLFFDNIARIISVMSGEKRYYALINNVEDPFYADRIRAKRFKLNGHTPFHTENIFSKAKRFIDNKINQFKLGKNKTDIAQEALPEIPRTMRKQKINNQNTVFAREMRKHAQEHTLIPIPKTQTILEKTLSEINQKIQDAEKLEEIRKLELKRTLKEARQAKKLKLISDVNDVIAKKLGKKTYEDQSITYSKKATKIRLSLLPDIFDSIKTTRKADRALGLKESVSSKDALELYKRINGHNRKIVRYMLLKEHGGTGTRAFTVKDIINFLDHSESIIAKNKAADKTFKPKSYYDTVYELYSNTFGKLQPKSKK